MFKKERFQNMRQMLPWRQWWLGYAFILSLVFFIVVSQISRVGVFSHPVGTPGYLKSRYFEATIRGAVKNPGTYVLPKGADISRLLEIAQPHPEADLKPLIAKHKLQAGQVVTVYKKPMITVYVQGAVAHPGPVRMPKGSRICDLRNQVSLLEGADAMSLCGKKRLKEGQVIAIDFSLCAL